MAPASFWHATLAREPFISVAGLTFPSSLCILICRIAQAISLTLRICYIHYVHVYREILLLMTNHLFPSRSNVHIKLEIQPRIQHENTKKESTPKQQDKPTAKTCTLSNNINNRNKDVKRDQIESRPVRVAIILSCLRQRSSNLEVVSNHTSALACARPTQHPLGNPVLQFITFLGQYSNVVLLGCFPKLERVLLAFEALDVPDRIQLVKSVHQFSHLGDAAGDTLADRLSARQVVSISRGALQPGLERR